MEYSYKKIVFKKYNVKKRTTNMARKHIGNERVKIFGNRIPYFQDM